VGGRASIPVQPQAPLVGSNGIMTLHNFIGKINWRQLLIHFVACWFFIHAFQTLSFLYNINLVDTIRQANGRDTIKILTDKGTTATELVYFQLWTSISGFIGLLVAFIISLLISLKRRWFWFNSIIILIATYAFYRLDTLTWPYSQKIFWYLGQMSNNSTVEFLINGLILLAIGIFIFFLKTSNRFIEKHQLAAV